MDQHQESLTFPAVELSHVPDEPFLKVEEAAKILRISRGAAYHLARRWLATNGQTGLPVIRLGRLLRVPRASLERLADTTPSEGAHEAEPVASEQGPWQTGRQPKAQGLRK